jgi:hypothetical protein
VFMEFHEAACIFPMMTDEQIESLAKDIETNGLIVPISVMDGRILDGRNRWLACSKISKTPKTVVVNPSDPIAYVLSMNRERRHLDDGQAAMAGARGKELYERQAKERQGKRNDLTSGPIVPQVKQSQQVHRARDKAGEAVGVSGKQVDRATKVLTHGSRALIEACDKGEVAVSAAAKLAVLPKAVQSEVIKQARDDGRDIGKAVAQAAKHAVARSDEVWTESELERKELVMKGVSVVANKRTDGRLIRWACENRCYVPIDRGTHWGNPFIVDEDGDRDRVCDSFDVFFELKPSLQNKIHSLKGKVLGCWCYPCRCHGDRLCGEANK